MCLHRIFSLPGESSCRLALADIGSPHRACSAPAADAGLAEIGRLPFLRCLYLSFCVRLTNAGLWHLVCGARRTSGDDSGGGGDDSSMNEAAGCTPSASLLRSLELYHCPQARAAVLPAWQLLQQCWGECLELDRGQQLAQLCTLLNIPALPLRPPAATSNPQVTNRGLQAVVAACPDLQCLNIGERGWVLRLHPVLHLSLSRPPVPACVPAHAAC